jgi:co-chaperonin GroES (HSP10)
MAIPKAKSAEAKEHEVEKKALLTSFKEAKKLDLVKIKPLKCLNDFVAIMPIVIEASIVLPETAYTNEGIVVGIGPGLKTEVRQTNQLEIGDVVLFNSKNTLTKLQPDEGVYKDREIFITQERSIFLVLRKIDFELVE